ncbi:MAG: amidohydrolase family protein [Rhodospirillaceae bacterium]|jgi:5-methylthioadenosine/S-adenosylhomocysteine deaminase|nr:amidohydrolase family protein [Rhodospirillaceae bacterium]MBT6137591.1 amidohydrolase family protein [Rhodospirillaceae bacterium]
MAGTTRIKGADWIVAWDESRGGHIYLQDADLVFRDKEILFVGPSYDGQADVTVDGRGTCLIPGLVNIHSHPSHELSYRGIREEHGVPEHFMSGLYERACAFKAPADAKAAISEAAYCELVLSGVTTLADLSAPYEGWAELMDKCGMRIFAAPGFASRTWRLDNHHELKFNEDIPKGRQLFDEAIAFIDQVSAHPSGRLSGIVFPGQIETCTADLLVDSIALARERGLPWTTHIAQSVVEFNLIVQWTGKTPIQWAHELGLLGPSSILGHAIFIDEHSWLHWWSKKDLGLIAETGSSVAHCPTPFSRYGQVLEDFGKYRAAGVNMGLGTDTFPQNLIEEMRTAAILARVSAHDIEAASTADVFHAATAGGAKALLRDDIGRLAVGAKADIVVVDLSNPSMRPVRDPLRSLVYSAADRAVRDVYIDGEMVVENRRVLTMDQDASLDVAREAQIRMEAAVAGTDWAGRAAEEIVPLSLPVGR